LLNLTNLERSSFPHPFHTWVPFLKPYSGPVAPFNNKSTKTASDMSPFSHFLHTRADLFGSLASPEMVGSTSAMRGRRTAVKTEIPSSLRPSPLSRNKANLPSHPVRSPIASILTKNQQLTPFGNSLSSMFSPAIPTQLASYSPHTGNVFSAEDIMNSTFVPTPFKGDACNSTSPEAKVNLTTVLGERQLNEKNPVPISIEKSRKTESSGSYFKRMGSPSYGIKKENKPPTFGEKKMVSGIFILVS